MKPQECKFVSATIGRIYTVAVELKPSVIDGQGVFALQDIPKGTIVWQFEASHDSTMTPEAFDALPIERQTALKRTAYLSDKTNRWIIPPDNDPACYTNHSMHANTITKYDPAISEEIVFVATKLIQAGEEITDNYLEYDPYADPDSQPWIMSV